MSGEAPGGLTPAEFKSMSAEACEWLFGMVQGSFNEKASVSQIIVDAVIGMIPLVGDVTAVRDLIATIMGLINDPNKREEALEWVSLVIMLLALIPVLGGVIKGVGRLTVHGVKAARMLKHAEAVSEALGKTATQIIEFMNRAGIGGARKWFLDLRVMQHQTELQRLFNKLMTGMSNALNDVTSWWITKKIAPDRLLTFIRESLIPSLKALQEKGKEMIPAAVKEFHQMLTEMQTFIRTGGTPKLAMQAAGTGAAHASANATHAAANTAQSTSHAAGKSGTMSMATPPKGGEPPKKPPPKKTPPKPAQVTNEPAVAGKNNKAPTKEARIREEGKGNPPKPKMGGYKQNTAVKGDTDSYKDVYKPKKGYEDLTKTVDGKGNLTEINAFSGKMTNRLLQPNEKIYRVFGPGGDTHKVMVKESGAGGKWWGIGEPPKSAKEWREKCAVRDEWNRDSFIVVGTPPPKPPTPDRAVKGVFGDVSEQFSEKIPGQYLPGGNPQAVLTMPKDTKISQVDTIEELNRLGKATIADGQTRFFTCPTTGITFEIKPTHWTDANGIHGYNTQLGQPGTQLGTASLARHDVVPQTSPETIIP